MDAVFLHRDIDPLVFGHLDHASKAALRLVSKAGKHAIDKTITKVKVEYYDGLHLTDINTLLGAGWDLQELMILFEYCPAVSAEVMLLLGGIRGWLNLKKLSIVYEDINSHEWRMQDIEQFIEDTFYDIIISEAVVGSSSMEALELCRLQLVNNGAKRLANLRWASNLKSLDLSHNCLMPESLKHLADVSPGLSRLILHHNHDIASHSVAPLTALASLTELDLNNTGWAGQGIAELARSLTALQVLDASFNNFSCIAGNVSELVMPRLRHLNLFRCDLPDAFFTKIKLQLPALEMLEIGANRLFANVLPELMTQCFPSLRTLGLSYCSLNGTTMAPLIAAGTTVFPRLENLNLTGNKELGVAGIRVLIINPWQIKELLLSNCGLGKDEVLALAQGNFPWLRGLDLDANRAVETEGVYFLVEKANMKSLEFIRLNGTGVVNPSAVEGHILQVLRNVRT